MNELKPFTKWIGGKGKLLKELNELLPKEYNNYYEPFVGGGALLFNIAPKNAYINDYNKVLIDTYKAIQQYPDELLETLEKHYKNNTSEYFYEIRAWDRNGLLEEKDIVERSGRFIYMLKVVFNGLYRVNKKNQFNASYGKYKNPNIINKDVIVADHNFLNGNNVHITNSDFQESVKSAAKGDLVYLDPPYIPLTTTSNFTSYTSNRFNLNDQKRLQKTFIELSNKGAYVILSNSDTSLTRDLYKDFNIHEVMVGRSVNTDGNKRGKVSELIITNY